MWRTRCQVVFVCLPKLAASCPTSVAPNMSSLAVLLMLTLQLSQPALGQLQTSDHSYARILEYMLSELDGTLELHLRSTRDYDNSFVKFLLRHQTVPRLVHLGQELSSMSSGAAHVLIYKHVRDLQAELRQFSNRSSFYIVALENSPPAEQPQQLQFMKSLWQRYNHNRIFYVRLETRELLLYNPFLQGITLVNFTQSYARIFRDLHGYSLRTYIFDSVFSSVCGDDDTQLVLSATGPDVKVAEAVAQHLNFTLDYVWPDDDFFGGRQANGSFNGGVGRAHRHEVDVIFAGFFIKDYLTKSMQFSAAVYMDDLCLFVKKAQRIPQSIVPLFAVRVNVWMCFLLVGFICAFIWLMLRYCNLGLRIERIVKQGSKCGTGREAHSTIFWRIFVDTWVVWVRVNVGQFPPYNSERIFLVSLCLVSVIFGALLESSLATAYIRPLYYRDINTLAELDDSGMPIYIKHPAFQDDLFYGHDSEVYRHLDAKMELVGDGEDRLINMVSQQGKFAGVTRSTSLELQDRRYIMSHKVHMIPQCPKTYHIGYVLPRPSLYYERINHVLLDILAGGLLEHWIGEVKEHAKRSIQHFPDSLAELEVGKWKVLTLTDVQLAFYALIIGCVLSLLVCLLEHWFQ